MSDERWDFKVLRTIPGSFQDRPAYSAGEGIMAQVVEDLGLVIGEDVEPVRANSMEQPAGNASRAEWARYAAIQAVEGGHPTRDEIDGMTRDELRDLYVEADEPAPRRRAAKAKPDTTEAGDVAEPAEED